MQQGNSLVSLKMENAGDIIDSLKQTIWKKKDIGLNKMISLNLDSM